jgi:uncharacterized protein (TIGR02246 family)
MSTDERAIRELIASWFDYTQRGEVEPVLELMTDDVVFMVVGREPFGKQEFAAGARQMQGSRVQARGEVVEVTVRGDTAWARVHIEVVLDTPDGRSVRRNGFALSVLTKQRDGRWLVTRDANLLGPAG